VTKTAHKTVCFLTGEGEADPDDASAGSGMGQFKDSVLGESYKINKLIWSPRKRCPKTAA